jgi:hypothetical protein
MITNLHNNQLKAVAATVTEMATMTAMTMTMKTKAAALLTAARHRQWQQAGGSKSAAEAGSAAARRRRRWQLGRSATLESAAVL